MNVYALELENQKWYVGASSDVDKRFTTHTNGHGAVWTKKYKPLNIHAVFENEAEDSIVIKYMAMYGIDNVRGGSFSSCVLQHYEQSVIQKMISTLDNTCFKCGKTGHFMKTCTNNDCYNKNTDKSTCKICESLYHFSEDCDLIQCMDDESVSSL